nr:hypothetical protein [Tanacetum cinerariifolium]
MNMSSENKAHFLAETEAIHLILAGIRDESYSTVDACQTAQEMWEAIESDKSSMNVQFLLQLQPEWQRFVTLVKQSQELKHVSYHKLYDILKQHQHEVNEIRAEKIARVANPLALVAQQQQEEAGIQLNAEQADWKDDTHDESDDQELEAHYMYMAKLQQV